jgi:TRAP-type C4-dicarboxylate transport system permease small subunit
MHDGGGAPQEAQGPKGLLYRATEAWALIGGVLLLAIALMTSYSASAGWLFGKPLPGDVEMVEMLTAVSVFMFLPYCQITGANVTADLFTAGASPRAVALLELLGAVVALAFSLLLLWRMYEGLLDYRQYVETTTILKIPIWWAYPAALASLALLAAAAVGTVRRALRRARQRPG